MFHYVPLHSSEAGRKFTDRDRACPVTDDISGRLLRLPFYTTLDPADQERVVVERAQREEVLGAVRAGLQVVGAVLELPVVLPGVAQRPEAEEAALLGHDRPDGERDRAPVDRRHRLATRRLDSDRDTGARGGPPV